MAMHINSHYNISSAGIFNGKQILHFFVIKPTFNRDNCGSFCLHCCGSRFIQLCAYFVTGIIDKPQFRHFYAATVALNGGRENHTDQTNAK